MHFVRKRREAANPTFYWNCLKIFSLNRVATGQTTFV